MAGKAEMERLFGGLETHPSLPSRLYEVFKITATAYGITSKVRRRQPALGDTPTSIAPTLHCVLVA